MADAKPNTAKPDAKPPKERKKLTASLAMTRFQRMMEELNEKDQKRLLAFVSQVIEDNKPATGA